MTAARRVVIVMLLAVMSGGVAGAQDIAVASTACGLAQRIIQHASGGVQVISRANPFDTSGQQLCISGSTSAPGFTIINSLRYTGAWQADPFTGACNRTATATSSPVTFQGSINAGRPPMQSRMRSSRSGRSSSFAATADLAPDLAVWDSGSGPAVRFR